MPFRIVSLLVLMMLVTEQDARAYTDPGTGTMMWQLAFAAVAGVAFYFRRITSWFKTRKGPKA